MQTLHEPPAGVLAGESVPRENEASDYERIKQERVATLRENAERLEADR